MDLDTQINCSECGYDLLGVARRGRCPECGQKYDISSNQGVSQHSSASRANERGDRVVYLVKFWSFVTLAVLCVGLGALRSYFALKPVGPMVIGGLFGSLFAFGALVTWFTERPGRPE